MGTQFLLLPYVSRSCRKTETLEGRGGGEKGGGGGDAAAGRWSGFGGGDTAQSALRLPQCIVYEVDCNTAHLLCSVNTVSLIKIVGKCKSLW